jgi:iron complex outermembrane receptor protein
MVFSKKRLLATAASILGMVATQPAHAQGAASAPQASGGGDGLSEIIVTARRASENLQRVPVAASVLSSNALERQGVSAARDLQFMAPSLVITPDPLGGSAVPIFQLRGQTSPLGSDDTVVTYFGDVPVDPRNIAAGIFDLASVQVIRGPQGTLFGKNSTGGAVIFTPRKADATSVSGYGEAQIGNYDFRQLTGAVNLPLAKDVLGLRVSGQITRQNGFVRNLLGRAGNDKHYEAARAVLTFTPGNGFENNFLGTYFNGRQTLNPYIATAIGGPSFFFPAAVAGFALQQQLGPRTIAMSVAPNSDNNKSYIISNTTSYKFGGVVLKNIAGYSNYNIDVWQNQPAYEFHQVDSRLQRKAWQISDELQLIGKSFDNSLNWIVGGFISKQRTHDVHNSKLFSPNINSHSDALDIYVSKALFGQATFDFSKVGLSGLKFTAGIRETWDKRRGSEVVAAPTPLKIDTHLTSWTLGLDYQVTDKILLYAVTRRSYKAGGFNLLAPALPLSVRIFAPETLQDVEVGVKAQGRVGSIPVRANLALYRGKYENIQTQVTGVCGALSRSVSGITNAGKGTPKGLELEVEVRPVRHLTLSGFYNRTLGKYDNFIRITPPGCRYNGESILTGQDFGNIAKDTAGLNANYVIPLSHAGEEISFGGNMYSRSDRLGNALLGFNSFAPGYTLYNARVDLAHMGGSPLNLGLFVRNITNKLYVMTNNNVLGTAGYNVQIYGDPRTYGVAARVEF